MSDRVKRTLKKMVKPKSAAAPIQYQFLSAKMLEPSSKAIPSLLTPLLSYQYAHAHLVNIHTYIYIYEVVRNQYGNEHTTINLSIHRGA